jgi:RimJ/RimL family protein N-acetyltransferase
MPLAPTIETPRLLLRSHRLDDFSDCVAMWSDEAITRYTIGSPSPPQRTWTRLLAYLGHWSLLGFGYWAVEEKATQRYVGELGFADFKRDLKPSIDGLPELGWALARHAHGKGFATEALRAVVDWADAELTSARTVCIVSPDNAASLRVADKIGYREYARTTKGGEAEILLARPREARRAQGRTGSRIPDQ